MEYANQEGIRAKLFLTAGKWNLQIEGKELIMNVNPDETVLWLTENGYRPDNSF
jgi:hypothetical protein